MARSDLAKRFNIKSIWEPYIQERAGRAFFEPRTTWSAPTYEYWWPFPFPAPAVPGLDVLPPDIHPGIVKGHEGAVQPGDIGQPRPGPRREAPPTGPGLTEALLGGLGGALAAGGIQRLFSGGPAITLPTGEEIAAAEAGAGLTGPPMMPTAEEILAAEAGAGLMGPPVLPTAEELAAAEAGAGLMGSPVLPTAEEIAAAEAGAGVMGPTAVPPEVPQLFPSPQEATAADAGAGVMGPPSVPSTVEEIMAAVAGEGLTGPAEVPSVAPFPAERTPAITDVLTPDVIGGQVPPIQEAPVAPPAPSPIVQGRFPGDPAAGLGAIAAPALPRGPIPQFVDEPAAAQFGEAAGRADIFGQEGELLTGAPYSPAVSSAPVGALPPADPGAIAGSASAAQGVIGPALGFEPPPVGGLPDISALFSAAEEAPTSALSMGLTPAFAGEVPSLIPPWLSEPASAVGKALSMPIPGTPFPLVPAIGAALNIASLPGREDLPDVAKGIRGGISAGGVLAAPATGGASLLFAAVPALTDLLSSMGERRPSAQRRWEHEQAGVRASFAEAMSQAESPEDIADIFNLSAGRSYTPADVVSPDFLRKELGGETFSQAAGGSGGNISAYSLFDAMRRLAPPGALPGIKEAATGYGASPTWVWTRLPGPGSYEFSDPGEQAQIGPPRGRYQDVWDALEKLPATPFPHVEGGGTEPLFNIWKRAGAPGFDMSYGRWMEDRAQRDQQVAPWM